MFNPTHYLVTKNRKTPVQVIPAKECFKLLTEIEAQQGKEPAFEMRPRQGFFCKDVLVLGFSLEPMTAEASEVQPKSTAKSDAKSESATPASAAETVAAAVEVAVEAAQETTKTKAKAKTTKSKAKEKSLA
jgi:2,3-bisphosphoglycerate-independent phosphoglycerate mutase